jgi:2-keto-3-deoxy-L-rhamnonate aldolase RhmA
VNTRIKDKLAAGGTATVVAPFASSAGLVELLGHMDFDGVFLDGEHGPPGWEDIEHMVRAAEIAGCSSVVRVEHNDASMITRALDRGASGVQVPHVNTAAEALAAVDHAKYAPIGQRGWSGWRASLGVDSRTFAQYANDHSLLAVMLEEVQALDNLDEILRVDHVDVFFVAPGDLAQSMNLPGQVDDPRVQRAIDDALRRIRDLGRTSGTLVTPKTLDHYLDLGVQFLYVGLASLLAPAAADFNAQAHNSRQ